MIPWAEYINEEGLSPNEHQARLQEFEAMQKALDKAKKNLLSKK